MLMTGSMKATMVTIRMKAISYTESGSTTRARPSPLPYSTTGSKGMVTSGGMGILPLHLLRSNTIVPIPSVLRQVIPLHTMRHWPMDSW